MADIDELEAAHKQVVAAINKRDLNALLDLFHENIVIVSHNGPFLVAGCD